MKKALAIGYVVVVHVALAILVWKLWRDAAGPFKTEVTSGSHVEACTLYYKDVLVADCVARDGEMRALGLSPTGSTSVMSMTRSTPESPWTYAHKVMKPGSFYGRDLGQVVARYDDTDGDGATDRFVTFEPRGVKVLRPDAWIDKQ
ncbi:MAG: hypothetical protein L6Q35_01465 [Phycisphaerales bacterium]|nr:hypothetical protein [Phycisphaerales bacterium]